jgi:long-subunit fatty acid transport protein
MRADNEFYNPSSTMSAGRTEAGLSGKWRLSEAVSLYALGQQTTDALVAASPQRRQLALGAQWIANQTLTLDASVRHSREDAGFNASSVISANAAGQGGFFGNGSDATNLATGTSILPLSNGNVFSNGTPNATFANATTVRLGAQYKASDRWSLSGEIEGGNNSTTRFGLGTSYQINERSRLFAKYERTTGLTSTASQNPSDKSNVFVAGVDSTFNNGPTVFSEFRMRDAIGAQLASARDQQLATGVRNTWNVKEGLAYTASVEHLKIFAGTSRDAFAVAGGVDYTASERWKTSARLEYRRLVDDKATVANDEQNQYLSTVSVARKLSRDWTFLARNYLLYQDNKDAGTRLEDRLQVGAAWRPVDHNRWNTLARYEFKTVRDAGTANPLAENYRAHIVSVHGDYHPSRPWWFNGRLAAKSTIDKTLPIGQQSYAAYLLGARAVYDITENWDVGAMASYMWSPTGSASQKAIGVEVGYLVRQNLWLSAGYNVTGFSDRELTGSDYTNKGFYIRLRFKFDENFFAGKNKDVNRALDR